MAVTKLTQDTLVDVINTSTGSVGYTPEQSTVMRKWEKQNVSKKVKLGELREVTGTTGGYVLFAENILLIKDGNIREELNLPELDGYTLTVPEIKDLLANKPLEDLVDMVENCTQDQLDTITNVAIETSLSDFNKIKTIEEYTGADVVSAIKENSVKEEAKPVEKTPAKRKPRAKKAE